MEKMSLSQLYATFDNQYCGGYPSPLHIFVLFPRIGIDSLPDLASRAEAGLHLEPLSENVYEIVLSLRKRYAQGFVVTYPHIWNLFIRPVESSVAAAQVTDTWLRKVYPILSKAYVESEQLLDILDSLKSTNPDYRVEVRGYLLKTFREPETSRTWPRDQPYIRRILERSMESRYLLDAIRFGFHAGEAFFETRISRNGHLVYYSGGKQGFSDLSRLILQPLSKIALENRKRFSGRERKIVGDEVVISPVMMKPENPLTERDLVGIKLALCESYTTSVIHGGNPWLLVSVIDRGDGSYFDIYGYEDEVVIVPFNRASPESLTKLYGLIRELVPSAKSELS